MTPKTTELARHQPSPHREAKVTISVRAAMETATPSPWVTALAISSPTE